MTLHNGALGATGSSFFALCAESRLPPGGADIVVLEHTLNDGEQIPPVTDPPSLCAKREPPTLVFAAPPLKGQRSPT